MAGSRLEKFGTLYKRVQGLVRSGAIKHEERPMWCQVYEAFPPRDPPEYERPIPNKKVPQILYPEDIVRAQFYKTYGNPDVVDLGNEKVKTTCQRFVDKYIELVQTDTAGQQVFEATATALKEQGLRLRTVTELQDSSMQAVEAGSASKPTPHSTLSVASIFGQDTVTQAQAQDTDFIVEDDEDRNPKL